MTHTVVEDGCSKEVLNPGPNPLGVGQHAHGGSSKHVDEGQDGKEEGSPFFADVLTLGIVGQEDERGEEAEEHENVAAQVEQEATVLKKGQVDERVDGLQHRLLWLSRRWTCRLVLWVRHSRLGFGSDGPHEGTGHAAVEQKSSQNEEASSPAKRIVQPRVQGSEGGEEDGAARHGDAVCDGPSFVEVFTDHRQGRVQVEGQSKSWREREDLDEETTV